MSKYYSYIFYADRNVRPWTILGYTLATFPKVATYIFMHNPRRNKDLSTIARKGTLHKLEKRDLALEPHILLVPYPQKHNTQIHIPPALDKALLQDQFVLTYSLYLLGYSLFLLYIQIVSYRTIFLLPNCLPLC